MNLYNENLINSINDVAGSSLCPPIILSDLKKELATSNEKQKDIKF